MQWYKDDNFCSNILDESLMNDCYSDFVLNDAEFRKDGLRCLDVFDYGNYYIHANNCLRELDIRKVLGYEQIMGKLNNKTTIDKYGYIYKYLSNYYKNKAFCNNILLDSYKQDCLESD
jgi:hypothetical protein